MSHRKYKTPPIQEAVCQFLFDAPLKVDVTLPGRLHGLINSDYDGTPKLLQEQNVAVGEGVNLPPSTQRYQFVSRDGQRILSYGAQSLTVHDLKPYSGWEKFEPRIMQAFSRFKEASGVGLPNKLSLRYINRIVIQEEPIQLDDYFRSMPIQDDSDEYLLPASVTAFFAKAEFRSPEEPFLVSNLSFATTTNEPGETGSAFFLDIDVIYNSGNIIEEGRIPTVLSMLREREYHMFEAFIKDKTREVFEQ